MTTLWLAVAAVLALLAGAAYWLLVVTEGAYLGPRVVRLLYDWGAASYDRVKQFDVVDDARALSVPLVKRLKGVQKPLVLDVATGTGRLPMALLRLLEFQGEIVGLDISLGMLQQARRKAAQHDSRVVWLWKNAQELPFSDAAFDAITCLEGLEFLPRPWQALGEMVRVLKPGGAMLISNRRGLDATLMPGRTCGGERLRELLGELGLECVEIKQWQTYYDLVWASKPGQTSPPDGVTEWNEVLTCPACGADGLTRQSKDLLCQGCLRLYPVRDSIVCLEGDFLRSLSGAQRG